MQDFQGKYGLSVHPYAKELRGQFKCWLLHDATHEQIGNNQMQSYLTSSAYAYSNRKFDELNNGTQKKVKVATFVLSFS
jgi:hypothetical protein